MKIDLTLEKNIGSLVCEIYADEGYNSCLAIIGLQTQMCLSHALFEVISLFIIDINNVDFNLTFKI